ncbi:MAG: ThiF family adenylyltransferase [Clostridia bacterium]|nr:ThiF family adenylyltransferase [Clostridia bacterium]
MNEKAKTQGFDLSGKCAAVVGCGGLGTNAAVHLCGMGIGRLLLIDGDTVETRNLNRQFFYTPADVGAPKCVLLERRLGAYAPDCAADALQKNITCADDLDCLQDADVVLAAVDNNPARRLLNDFCKTRGVPLVNGGINGFFGTAYAYLPGKTPDLDTAGLLDAENEKPLSVSSAVGLIGALQAQLAAQLLCGDTACAGRLYILDNNEIHSITIR